MIKTIIVYIPILLLAFLGSCQNNSSTSKEKAMPKYKWQEGKSAPLGYPADIFRGGFEMPDGFQSMYGSMVMGEWGGGGGGMGEHLQSLPSRINVQWVSYAEGGQMYELDTPITASDRQKMEDYFNTGYEWLGRTKLHHETYNEIIAGFAPGGVVVIWVAGVGTQHEIGRYQGHKITIPQSVVDKLESMDKVMFDSTYRKGIMTSEGIIPLELQRANKNKPIPYGLWDTYRKKYRWKLVIDLPKGISLDVKSDYIVEYFNGEKESGLLNKFPQHNYNYLPIPKALAFSWITKDTVRYAGNFTVDESSVFAACDKIFKDSPDSTTADLVIQLNMANTYFTIKLRGSNGKEVNVKTKDQEIFKP